jgi:hypothetical protein
MLIVFGLLFFYFLNHRSKLNRNTKKKINYFSIGFITIIIVIKVNNNVESIFSNVLHNRFN